jgi:DGQHR domain-containing protein
MPKRKNKFSFPCLSLKQDKYDLVCFVVKAHELWTFVKVNTRESDKDTGYQRALSTSRVKALSQYIDNGNAIPNSVLISFDETSDAISKNGVLSFTAADDAAWVIDGQHRLAGAHESSKNIELIVVAFIGLKLDEQINQFVTINREAKGVPTSLYYDLLKYLPNTTSDADLARERAANIADVLKKNEGSPFFQKIVISAPKKGQISLTNFVRKVSPLVIDKKGKFHTYIFLEQVGIINNYFSALEHVFPKQFNEDKQTFFRTLGFGAMINALVSVFDLSLREYQGFRVEDAVKILKRVDYFEFDSWSERGSGSAAEIMAGEDFRQELLKHFIVDGQDAETLRLK